LLIIELFTKNESINIIMEKNEVTAKKKTNRKGGARPGAGRPKGSTEQVTIGRLLETIKAQAKGKDYEEILVEDFLRARNSGDSHMTVKYHNLILNKVMNNLAKIEVTESEDLVEAKQLAFAEALAKLTGIKKE
jgi:hypothetical protein